LETILADVKGALSSGYGDDFTNYNIEAKNKLQLSKNLYRFSAAKTYQELAKINYHSQQSKSFADFKKEALKINKEYNVQYLETEYINANRAGVMAKKWHKAQSQKGLYPNLKYKTVKDSRVREEHRQLHDVIKPIDDAFWDKWLPQNGHRCRCYVVQTDEAPTPGTPEGNPTPGFHGNVGKSNMVFNDDEHPYFIFPAADAKIIKESFEDLKLSSPDYNLVHTNKKATLKVSTWADPKDLEANLKSAKILVDELGINVKIRPHSDIHGVKNPEYSINNKTAELKTPIGKGYKNILKKASEQKCEYVVVNLENNDNNLEEARHLMRNILKQKGVHPTIKNIIIISKDGKAYDYERSKI
jgi:SPP1 gp7 family putative phage head morphogenesis protein